MSDIHDRALRRAQGMLFGKFIMDLYRKSTMTEAELVAELAKPIADEATLKAEAESMVEIARADIEFENWQKAQKP